MLRRWTIAITLTLLVLGGFDRPADGLQLERMRAYMAGTGTPVEGGRCPAVTVAVRATGYATWLGAYSAVQEQCADPAGADPLAFTDGVWRWTSEGGEQVYGRYNGRLLPVEGSETHGFFKVDGRFTIEGGTGRFAGATGSGVADGLLNPLTGAFNIALDASLSLGTAAPGR